MDIRSKIASTLISFPNLVCHPLGSICEQKIVEVTLWRDSCNPHVELNSFYKKILNNFHQLRFNTLIIPWP